MTDAKHTPGPWEVTGTDTVQTADGFVVAWGAHFDQDGKTEANARLIAAAPEMLETLERFVRVVDLRRAEVGVVPTGIDVQRIEHYARAAIAKARGAE